MRAHCRPCGSGKRVLRFSEIDLVEWENFKLAHDRTKLGQTDESGGSSVLSGAGADTGSREGESKDPAKRNQRAKSIFALDEPTADPVHQSAERSEERRFTQAILTSPFFSRMAKLLMIEMKVPGGRLSALNKSGALKHSAPSGTESRLPGVRTRRGKSRSKLMRRHSDES